MGSWIPGRAGYDDPTTEATMQGSKAVPFSWIEAPAQPAGASNSLAHILVAMSSRHDQSSGLFEVVNTSVFRADVATIPGSQMSAANT